MDKDFLYDQDILDMEQKMFARSNQEDKDKTKENTDKEKTDKPKLKKLEPIKIDNTLQSVNPSPKTPITPKENIRKDTLAAFVKILDKNEIFKKESSEFVSKLSKDLEKDLFDEFNNVDHKYKSAFMNMSKTVKELENYKNVSILIAQKKKLNINKVSKFPYGDKVKFDIFNILVY